MRPPPVFGIDINKRHFPQRANKEQKMSDTSAVGLQALSGTFAGLTTITIAMRFYSRHRSKAPVLIDDWLMIPAWVCHRRPVTAMFDATITLIASFSPYAD